MKNIEKNERRTEIICIIDRSGSMESVRYEAIIGLNQFMDEQRKLSEAADVTMVFFNNRTMTLYMGKPIVEVPWVTVSMYEPDGNTALLDAVGEVVEAAELRQKALGDQSRIVKTIVCILTDGLENASTRYTQSDIKRLISRKEEDGWDFIYLGAEQNAREEGSKIGIQEKFCIQFERTSQSTTEVFYEMSEIVCECRAVEEPNDFRLLPDEDDIP